jgi:hypothetical protein
MYLREKKILPPTDDPVLSYVGGAGCGKGTAPPKGFACYVVKDVLQTARCSEQAAVALVNWLIDVARQKPLVFNGAWAEPTEGGVCLTNDGDHSDKPLRHRWSVARVALASDCARLPKVPSGTAMLS